MAPAIDVSERQLSAAKASMIDLVGVGPATVGVVVDTIADFKTDDGTRGTTATTIAPVLNFQQTVSISN